VGDAATPADLASNWELVHEMVHLAFPSMRRQAWIEEGLATYVEPLVRARAGLAPADDIWKWLVSGLPQGQKALTPGGLDGARSWAATYWGGALFCFDADVEIRQKSDGKKSLDDALRGIVRAGGNVTVSWTLEKALETGDRAVGLPVLSELYARMAKKAPSDDLDAVFRSLGVRGSKSAVSYDDHAPLASIRRGISTGK
jgi:predicted metalloprotease with PDZ domain